MNKRNDTRTGVLFIALKDTGCATLTEAFLLGWRASAFASLARYENMVWVYDADHMVLVKDRHGALDGKVIPISEVTSNAPGAYDPERKPNYRCIRCEAEFYSCGGKIVSGTCGKPERNAACPLDVIR